MFSLNDVFSWHVLHVNPAYPPFLGGAEIYTQAISERFQRDGHQVTVVTTDAAEVEYFWNPRKRHVEPGREQRNGVDVIRCPVRHLPVAPWSFYLLRRLATWIAQAPIDTTPVLRRLVPHMPGVPEIELTLTSLPATVDIVHGVNIALEWPLVAAWRYARRNSLPFVVTPFVHVGEYGRTDVVINYVMPHQLEVLRDADAVIVQTDIEGKALERYGVSPSRIHKVGMGVDLTTLQGGEGQRFRTKHTLTGPVVTFLGVVTYDKGSFHLVQAMEQMWNRGYDAHLVIAGPPVDEFLRFYNCLSEETRERIILLGPVLGQDKQDLLAATDVFVLPSRIDSFGIVYLEAWAYKKPVIGARAGGVPDVIAAGVDGILVDFGDVGELADAITQLLAEPALQNSFGQQGYEKVKTCYTWERIYTCLREIYGRLVR